MGGAAAGGGAAARGRGFLGSEACLFVSPRLGVSFPLLLGFSGVVARVRGEDNTVSGLVESAWNRGAAF